MSEDCFNIVYEHRLEVLNDQNAELLKQISLLKQSNDFLINGLQEVESLKQQNYKLTLQNKQLTAELENEKQASEHLQNKLEQQIKNLQQQLNEKNNYIERLNISHQKQIFKAQDELRKSKIEQRKQKFQNLEEQINKSIQLTCSNQNKKFIENQGDHWNKMNYTQYQPTDRYEEKSQIASRMSYRTEWMGYSHNKEDPCKNKYNTNFKNYTKEELKMAIKTLNKAGKNLKEGSAQVSQLKKSQHFLHTNAF